MVSAKHPFDFLINIENVFHAFSEWNKILSHGKVPFVNGDRDV